MASSFASLKKSRSSSLNKLLSESTKLSSGGQKSGGDDRLWKPEVDKAGNGYAVLRFLPEPKGEDLPWVRMFDHGFQGTGGWYIENSLTTINQKDPVSEYNSMLWNNGTDAGKEQARKQKRRLSYIANVMIVKDPARPELEGKVMLYKFGKKIFDKLNESMNPAFEDEEAINPFDFWEGADFKLKIRQVEGYRNYDKSEFASPTPLSEDEAELESVYEKLYDLNEFTDPASYKTYDELKTRLQMVLGEVPRAQIPTVQAVALEEVRDPAPMRSSAAPEPRVSEGDEDTMSFFAKLANED